MRALFIYLVVAIHLIIISPVVFFRYWYFVLKGNKKDYKKIYKLNNGVFASVLKIGKIKYDVIGMENIDKLENGFLVVANHQSYFDIPLLSLVLRERGVSFVAKKSILKAPIVSHYMQVMSCLFLDRESVKSGMQMIKEGSKLLSESVNLVIFPEGTRSDDGSMREFKSGSLKLATRVNAPIVPISISHSFDLHPSGMKMNKGMATIYIHPAINSEEYNEMKASELNDLVESKVASKVMI